MQIQRWEYMIKDLTWEWFYADSKTELENILDRYGKEGWDLASVDYPSRIFFFKRPILIED